MEAIGHAGTCLGILANDGMLFCKLLKGMDGSYDTF